MIYTTLNRIRANSPLPQRLETLLALPGKKVADDEPLPLIAILDTTGLDDALWCLRAEPQHAAIWRLYAVHCARRVQHLMQDPRSLAALDVAERHATGGATDEELAAARTAARGAAWASARDAAGETAWAAAQATAWRAARDAAWAACAVDGDLGADLRTVLEHYDAAPGGEINNWRGKDAA